MFYELLSSFYCVSVCCLISNHILSTHFHGRKVGDVTNTHTAVGQGVITLNDDAAFWEGSSFVYLSVVLTVFLLFVSFFSCSFHV